MTKRKVSNDKIKSIIRKKNTAPDDDELVYDLSEQASQSSLVKEQKQEPEPKQEQKKTKKELDEDRIIEYMENLFKKLEESSSKKSKERQERYEKLREERDKKRQEELRIIEELVLTGRRKTAEETEKQTKDKLKKTIRQSRINSLLF